MSHLNPLIQNSPLLRPASLAMVALLERTATVEQVDAGVTLFEQGEDGDAMYFLDRGQVEISVLSVEGRRVALHMLGPGEVFGEIALFDAGPRTATATATQDARLTRIRREDLFRELSADADLALEMIELAGRRMRLMTSQLQDQVFLSSSARLARKILSLADRFSDGKQGVSLSQSSLAEHVAVSREAVSRCLSDWRKAGWISVERNSIKILDREAMESQAELDII